MLTDEVQNLLNDQVAKEFYASNYYLAMASWCDTKGFQGATSFFIAQSNEEREHGMRIFHYINGQDGHAVAPQIDQPPTEFESFQQLFDLGLSQEKENTSAIHEIVDVTLSQKDYSTYNFMHWYLDEQVEEENLFRSILDKFDIIGDDRSGLYLLDKELGENRTAAE